MTEQNERSLNESTYAQQRNYILDISLNSFIF